MLPNKKDIDGKLSSFCVMIKDMQICVIVTKTAFPIKPDKHKMLGLSPKPNHPVPSGPKLNKNHIGNHHPDNHH